MKIIIKISKIYDDAEKHEVIVNGKTVASIYPLYECPEDATLERDMINGYQIAEYIKMGYEAGIKDANEDWAAWVGGMDSVPWEEDIKDQKDGVAAMTIEIEYLGSDDD